MRICGHSERKSQRKTNNKMSRRKASKEHRWNFQVYTVWCWPRKSSVADVFFETEYISAWNARCFNVACIQYSLAFNLCRPLFTDTAKCWLCPCRDSLHIYTCVYTCINVPRPQSSLCRHSRRHAQAHAFQAKSRNQEWDSSLLIIWFEWHFASDCSFSMRVDFLFGFCLRQQQSSLNWMTASDMVFLLWSFGRLLHGLHKFAEHFIVIAKSSAAEIVS